MIAQELAKGLWRWTAPHPAWTPDRGGPGGWEQVVASTYYEAPDAVVLIDPQVPSDAAEVAKFWTALDRDVERAALPLAVLIGNSYHARSADAILARYGARVETTAYLHEEARGHASCEKTKPFADGAALPGGVRAHHVPGLDRGETAFWIPKHRALVFADAVLGAGAGEVRIAPPSWANESPEGAESYRREFRTAVERLVALDPAMLLLGHGEPVLRDGAAALARAVASPAWGEEPGPATPSRS